MTGARSSLRRWLLAAFGFFSLLTALAFSAFCLLFVYVVEDHFFDRTLEQEAAHQYRHWSSRAGAAPTLFAGTRLYASSASFPPDLARHAPVGTGEYAGTDGRHYHVLVLSRRGYGGAPYLVAEVSRELFVRPRLPAIAATLGASALALLLVTLGAGLWLGQRALGPLSRLAALVERARPEDLPRGFAATFPSNEIGALAVALEEAIGRIADFIDREQHFTCDASHELRTPLTVIDGAAYLLAQQPLGGQAAAQVERIRQAAAHMQQVVRTLLALAREDDQSAWPAERFALLPLIESSILRHAGHAVRRDIRVELDADVQAHCPRRAFVILLDNLVANALAHAPGVLRLYIRDGWLVVEDRGPGIAPELRERLGQPGVKGSGSAGFGLGLSISQRLAARAGIPLRIEHPGDGGMRAALAFDRPRDSVQPEGRQAEVAVQPTFCWY
jgi:signal transduction histidine kinase